MNEKFRALAPTYGIDVPVVAMWAIKAVRTRVLPASSETIRWPQPGSPYLTGVTPIRPLRPAHPDPAGRAYGALAADPAPGYRP